MFKEKNLIFFQCPGLHIQFFSSLTFLPSKDPEPAMFIDMNRPGRGKLV